MEFSFDRSKDAPQRRTESQTSAQPEQSAGPRPGPDLNTLDPSTIANERLRKAIERNRAKQASRAQGAPSMSQAQPQPQAQAYAQPEPQPTAVHVEPEPVHQQESFFSQPIEPQMAATEEAPRVRVRERTTPPPPPQGATVISRRSVAKPEDTEFVPAKRSTRKVASQISYATSSASSRKKVKSVDPKYVTWLVKGSWIFCALMVLRLIFANGGVTDFYSQKSIVSDRLNELQSIKKENMQLVREIERMRSDTGFQKKLVRDNLGFIASDEFLVLFPK